MRRRSRLGADRSWRCRSPVVQEAYTHFEGIITASQILCKLYSLVSVYKSYCEF